MEALKNLLEVVRGIKRKKTLTSILCPRCRSRKIHLSSRLDGWLTPTSYICDDCGYRGPLILELEEEGRGEN